MPVAHGEGKFFANDKVLDTIKGSEQVALRYVDVSGGPAGYPANPNGSLESIAGITDTQGKVFGLMPHPERCFCEHHHPFWQQKEEIPFGRKIFQNAIDYFK